jgi:hypothetical protein
MAHIPDDLVIRHVEHVVKSDRQFYDAKTRGQMPAVGRHDMDNPLSDFLCQIA